MLQRLLANFTRIDSANPHAQQRSLVVVVLVIGMVVVAILFLPIAFLYQPYPLTSMVVEGVALVLFSTTLVLVRRGRIAAGVLIFLCTLILGPLLVMIGARFISSTPISMLFSVMIASLLVRPNRLWYVLLINLAGLYFVVGYLSATGYVLDDYDITIVALMPIVLLMATLIGYLGASTIAYERAALQRALDDQRLVEVDLLRAKEAAEAANRAKSSFLANMSHELRTPLTAILGYTNLLSWQAAAKGDQEYQADLVVIERSGQHLLSLINNLLDLSKIEAGKVELVPETFDIAAMLAELSETVLPLVAKNRNRLIVQPSPTIGAMYADQTKVRQVLINLLSNASKYTEQGTITVMARAEEDAEREWVIFSVADTGIGIAPEAVPQLFQPFKRVLEPVQATKYDGAGLGLALSQHICRMMGGLITVASTPNVGTTFMMRLPRHVDLAGTVEDDAA